MRSGEIFRAFLVALGETILFNYFLLFAEGLYLEPESAPLKGPI
jgi:hypothetical protein